MDSCRHLMLADESVAPVDIATDLAIPVVAEGGLAALTPSALAVATGYTRQAIHQWFGGQQLLRQAVAARFVARWRAWVDARTYPAVMAGLLPEDDQVRQWCRVWLALVEAGPRDAEIGGVVALAREGERSVIRTVLLRRAGSGAPPASDPGEVPALLVSGLQCLVEGLRTCLCSPEPSLSYEDAVAILDGAVGARPGDGGRHVA